MPKKKNLRLDASIQHCRAQVVNNSFNEEAGTFDIIFATETPVYRRGWDENYNEVLVCSQSAVRMDRINAGLPLLNRHPTYEGSKPEDVMGKISNVRFENASIIGTVTLGAQATEQIRSDLKSGILDTFSVGYNIYKGSREENLETNTVTYRMTDWEPNHVAIAPIPADINSKMREKENNNEFLLETEDNMTKLEQIRSSATEEQKVRLAAIEAICRSKGKSDDTIVELFNSSKTIDQVRSELEPKQVNIEEVRAKANDDSKKRLDDILESTRAAKLDDSKAIEFYRSDKSLSQIRQEIISEFAKDDPKVNTVHVGEDGKRDGIVNALANRLKPECKLEEGNQYRNLSLLEIGRELIPSSRSMSKDVLAGEMLKRTMSTSDFPLLLENAVKKTLLTPYQASTENWTLISKETSNADFKPTGLYRISGNNGMKEIEEGGELTYGSLNESKQKIELKSYGEGLILTRQAIINDDLSAFAMIPSQFAMDWDQTRGKIVWDIITSNQVIDGKPLFDAAHANLGTAAALSETSLQEGITKMKTQTGLDGKTPIVVIPKYLIVPPGQEFVARKLLASITPTKSSDVNVFSNMGLNIIVEHRLTGKAWYLAADPASMPCLYHAYLNGASGLRFNMENSFNIDGVKYAVRGDFGANLADWRGLFKNAGA